MSVTLGFLVQFVLGAFLSWRQTAMVNALVPVFCLIFLSFIPESPIWLLAKNKPKKARESIAWLRGWTSLDNVDEEFEELSKKIKEEQEFRDKNTSKSMFACVKFLLKKEIYWPLAVVCYTFFLAYFNGSETVTIYAIEIFKAFQTTIDEYFATVLLGLIQLLSGIISLFLINRLGKRLLTFISLFGTGISFLVVSIYIYSVNILQLNQDLTSNTTKHWVPAVFLVLSAFFSFIGIIFLPWTLIGEVFPNEERAKASGLASAIAYVFGFLSNKIFLYSEKYIYLPGVFMVYACISLLGLVGLHFILPETEGKTIHEICNHFKGKIKLDNKVKRKTEDVCLQNP